MSQQLTFRMPDDLADALARAAKRARRSRSDLVRLAVEHYLETTDGQDHAEAERPIDRVRDLIGSIETGVSDLGTNHREHVLERIRRSRAKS